MINKGDWLLVSKVYLAMWKSGGTSCQNHLYGHS